MEDIKSNSLNKPEEKIIKIKLQKQSLPAKEIY